MCLEHYKYVGLVFQLINHTIGSALANYLTHTQVLCYNFYDAGTTSIRQFALMNREGWIQLQ